MEELSSDLKEIYDLELRLGNRVKRVDQAAWTKCPLAINFELPLHFTEIEEQIDLPASVVFWTCTDSHYPIQSGYSSKISRHSIAGPNPNDDSARSVRSDC